MVRSVTYIVFDNEVRSKHRRGDFTIVRTVADELTNTVSMWTS